MVEIRFWGVRGSIATPGTDTAGVGGNTSCVELTCGERRVVLDAGTGLRPLGRRWLADGPVEATLLLSHLHWDHIQGLPFFVPLYLPTTRLTILGPGTPEAGLRESLARQMAAPHFPVRWDEVGSWIEYRTARPVARHDLGDGLVVRTTKLNHPGGSLAYRVEHGGRAVVYATDTEHYSCIDPCLSQLARGADVLIYDAQYTPDEYAGLAGPSKVGWGHSTWEAAARAAIEAGVGQLVLFHHDPSRDDAGVAEIERRARAVFPATVAAREGLTLTLAPRAGREAA